MLEALLWAFHNAKSGICFPSYEKIAEAASCARSTVAEVIKALGHPIPQPRNATASGKMRLSNQNAGWIADTLTSATVSAADRRCPAALAHW